MKRLLATISVLFISAQAFADGAEKNSSESDIGISVGSRFWNATWNANSVRQLNNKDVVLHADSETSLVTIPVIAVRYKDFGASASYFTNTDFTLSDNIVTKTFSRKEWDLNASYFILPNLAAGVGYKDINWDGVKIYGPTVSLSATAPLASGISMYGTIGYGWQVSEIFGINDKLNTKYTLGEFGLAYSTNTGWNSLKAISFTAGYRNQKISINGSPIAGRRDINDITSGMTIGVIGRF